MAIENITMPQLGESVTEGTINTWLVKVGDNVNKYDPIADIMTDKVNAEVPSSFAGTIKEIIAFEGDTIDVGELMCTIETDSISKSEDTKPKQNIKKEDTDQKLTKENEYSMKTRYSPAVLKIAQENDIDLATLSGTGRSSRITRKDIEQVIKNGINKKQNKKEEIKKTSEPIEFLTEKGDIEIPITGVRKRIAENLVRSKQEIPHAWMTIEVDVTDLVKYRNNIKSKFKQQEGYNLTYFSFFVNAVALALKEFPQLNSTWANDKIIQRRDINLSIAIANEDELYVPVIHNADEKSINGIAKKINDLAIKTRSNNLTADDMNGGTFTVNNTGSFGSIHSMGIINYPQAAILQVESIVKRPMIINDDMFAVRDMVNLSLSIDHRILDGLVCGRFLARIKEILESININSTNIY